MKSKKGNKTQLAKKSNKKKKNAVRRSVLRKENHKAKILQEHLELLNYSLSGKDVNLEKHARILAEKIGKKMTADQLREEIEAHRHNLLLKLGGI